MKNDVNAFGKVVGGCLGAVVLFFGLGVLLFFYSTGTVYVTMTVDARVLDRETERPVRNCLLSFEGQHAFAVYTTRARTETTGRAQIDAGVYSYVGSHAAAFQDDHSPELRLYLGERPRPGTSDEAESWMVRLTFKQPWLVPNVTPAVSVQRSRARSDPAGKLGDREQPLQFDSLATEPADKLARATVAFDTTVNHRPKYRIALTLLLDPSQISACQTEPHPSGR